MTKYRELILTIIKSSPGHLTAEEVYEAAHCQNPKIVMATVYNSLAWLSDNGFIKKLNLKNGVVNYDKSTKPHEHCVCAGCGRIFDFKLPDLQEQLKSCLETDILDYELTVSILCEECKNDKNAKIDQ